MAVAAILPAWWGRRRQGGKARREEKVARRRIHPPHLHGDISSGPAGSSTHGQLLGDGGLPGQGGRRGAGK